MRHVEQKPRKGGPGDVADRELAEREAQVMAARQAFGRGLEDASREGTRAVRRFVTPLLWGVALAGGALALIAIVRLTRRRPAETPLVQIAISGIDLSGIDLSGIVARPAAHPILPVLGAAVARAVLQRFISDAPDSSRLSRAMVQSNQLSTSAASPPSSNQGPFVSGQLETLG